MIRRGSRLQGKSNDPTPKASVRAMIRWLVNVAHRIHPHIQTNSVRRQSCPESHPAAALSCLYVHCEHMLQGAPTHDPNLNLLAINLKVMVSPVSRVTELRQTGGDTHPLYWDVRGVQLLRPISLVKDATLNVMVA